MTSPAIVRASGLSKAYGAVQSLTDVTFTIGRGEIVGFAGDNGAGKSTLMKLIAGSAAPSEGRIIVDGVERTNSSPAAARREGIEMVYQDLALCENLNVYENIYLGHELKRRILGVQRLAHAEMREGAHKLIDQLGLRLTSLLAPVSVLSGGQKQMVAICRSIAFKPKVVIMDEPTAALSVHAGQPLLDLIRRLPESAVAVMLVSHRLSDLLYATSRIYVMRHGRIVAELKTADATEERLLSLMAGFDEEAA